MKCDMCLAFFLEVMMPLGGTSTATVPLPQYLSEIIRRHVYNRAVTPLSLFKYSLQARTSVVQALESVANFCEAMKILYQR
jgi:hypothetical protein